MYFWRKLAARHRTISSRLRARCQTSACVFVIIILRTCTINERFNNARPRRTCVIAAHYARGEKTHSTRRASELCVIITLRLLIVEEKPLTLWEINLVWGKRGENPVNRNAHSAQIHGNLLNGSSILSQSVCKKARARVCVWSRRKI